MPEVHHTTTRMEKLRGLCFRWLQKGHVAENCQKPQTCTHCGRNNHHRSLCPKLFPASENKLPESILQVIGTQDDTEKTSGNEATMVCGSHVFMQTATATVTSTLSNQSMPVRMILDSGSQRTYVTEKLANNLKLKLSSSESATVATFGSDKPKQIKYKPTELQLNLRDGSMMLIEANVVPHITGKLS